MAEREHEQAGGGAKGEGSGGGGGGSVGGLRWRLWRRQAAVEAMEAAAVVAAAIMSKIFLVNMLAINYVAIMVDDPCFSNPYLLHMSYATTDRSIWTNITMRILLPIVPPIG